MTAPQVTALWRHPIKGHGREAVSEVTLETGKTMPWDRRWAVTHEASQTDGQDWAPCVNFSRGSKVPALMAINTVSDEDSGKLTLTHPDLDPLSFDPDTEAARFVDWVRPIMPPERAQSVGLVRVPDRGMTDTDYPSVSLINLASNADLSTRMGSDLSPLRWRCNIHFDGFPAWSEFDWVGRSLRIGDAELAVEEPIVRCLATTANPTTGARDQDTLQALSSAFDHKNFGIYAAVTKGGTIRPGDVIEVL